MNITGARVLCRPGSCEHDSFEYVRIVNSQKSANKTRREVCAASQYADNCRSEPFATLYYSRARAPCQHSGEQESVFLCQHPHRCALGPCQKLSQWGIFVCDKDLH